MCFNQRRCQSITIFGIDFSSLSPVPSPSNPLDVATALHIHQAPRGQNGGVVFGIFQPDQDLDDRVVTFNPLDESTTISGVWDSDDPSAVPLATVVPGLLATASGEDTDFYINLHSVNDPGGIIRGQIVATSVPEPASLASLLAFAAISGSYSLFKQKK
ncbi:MAG: CHRD domain-containing protein [Crocosphaera sp.]|nr:CHRD domain-containing protein [Crocosphaera sp.]